MPPGFNVMMFIERKHVRVMCYRAAIHDGLAVVFAGWLQVVQLEQAVGSGVKTYVPCSRSKFRVTNSDPSVVYQSGVGKAVRTGKVEKIVPVQRTAQAFTVQHRVRSKLTWNTPVGINIRKIKLATGLEHAPGFF